MGLKSNFTQAVSELIGISEHQEAVSKTEEREEEIQVMTADPKERIKAILASRAQNQAAPSMPESPQIQESQQPQESIEEAGTEEPMESNDQNPVSAMTTIMKGSVIIGEIHAEEDLELQGSVKGKITAKGKIRAMGKVVGDLTGHDVELSGCQIQGNIVARGTLTVDNESMVIGDVTCKEFCLGGKIKGNVTTENEAKFLPTAILSGNVKAASIAMSQGAKIKGEINIPLSDNEEDLPFGMEISI